MSDSIVPIFEIETLVTTGETKSILVFAVEDGHLSVLIGGRSFAIGLGQKDLRSQFVALYHDKVGDDLNVHKIAAAISSELASLIPEDLTINLNDALFAFSAAHGLLVGLHVGTDISLSNLPLVGRKLPDSQTISVTGLQLLVASRDFTIDSVKQINGAIASIESDADAQGLIKLPEAPLSGGCSILATLRLGDSTQVLQVPVTVESGGAESPQATGASSASTTSTSAGSSAKQPDSLKLDAQPKKASSLSLTKWFPIKKTLGPAHFEKIGLQYENRALWFLLDASLSAAGLTISLEGLGVGSELRKFSPQFKIAGLGIDYDGGGVVEIGGAFLRTEGIRENQEKYDIYNGSAVIKTKAATISGLGSYAELKGHPSLFVYAFLNYPLGGPAFFFVTGLAAGFGYNRKLIIPAIEDVIDFPLVREALGLDQPEDLEAELERLQDYVPPTIGEAFLAVGVRFTTFKLIDSFALLTIEFGSRVVCNILGLSTAIVPTPEAGQDVTPLAEVQMAWKATFDPDEGFLGLSAQLTANSYILSHDCHLTGGFAFYSWFAGEHAGDFVQTMGGYHPAFNVPAHYPSVPRLQFNWRVTSNLTLKGDAYYALCGSALMAGGHLDATWESGDLKAWFKAGADFLIQWKPYHYDASIYVDVGVSYTFKINLLFTSIRVTISVDVGADLHIWGPDFSGHARVHLWIITFGISFGADASQEPPPIDWPTFQASFLPAADGTRNSICSLAVKDGLVRTSSSSLLRVVDFIDAAGLVSKVREAKDPVSTYLQLKLKSGAPELLASTAVQQQLKTEQLEALVNVLNDLIKEDHSFYEKERFAQVALRKATKVLLGRNPQGKDLLRLNRMLLEDAYPDEVVDSSFWVINPKHFSLLANTAIPLKRAEVTKRVDDQVVHQPLGIGEARTGFGIGSMAIPARELKESALTITIRRDGNLTADDFSYAPILKKVPAGLWGESSTPDLNGEHFIDDALTGYEITPGKPPTPGATKVVSKSILQYSSETLKGAYQLRQIKSFGPSSGKLDETVRHNAKREKLLEALGFDPTTTVHLERFPAGVFLRTPQIGHFGD